MNTKELAHTGVMIPEVGLGTWKYASGIEPLQRGIELGSVLIDTAEAYGNEQLVGQTVHGIRDRVFIATKVSPQHFRYDDILKSADKSLEFLGTDHIDLYQLHWPNSAIPIEETMAAMEALVDAGKIRFIGVSNFSVSELKRAQAALSRHKIVSNQVPYNLTERRIEDELLGFCRAKKITVIAYSPLAHGLENILARDSKGAISKVAQMTGRTAAQVALNWCISKEGVIAIPKASSIERVEENCDASGWRLTHEQILVLEKSIRFQRRGRAERTLRRLGGKVLRTMGWH